MLKGKPAESFSVSEKDHFAIDEGAVGQVNIGKPAAVSIVPFETFFEFYVFALNTFPEINF